MQLFTTHLLEMQSNLLCQIQYLEERQNYSLIARFTYSRKIHDVNILTRQNDKEIKNPCFTEREITNISISRKYKTTNKKENAIKA